MHQELNKLYGEKFLFAIVAGADVRAPSTDHPIVHRQSLTERFRARRSKSVTPLTPPPPSSSTSSATPGSGPTRMERSLSAGEKPSRSRVEGNKRRKRLGPVGLQCERIMCEVFQCNNKDDFREWTQAILAHMRLVCSELDWSNLVSLTSPALCCSSVCPNRLSPLLSQLSSTLLDSSGCPNAHLLHVGD